MRTLILNSTNLIQDGQNNKMVYRFPSSVQFKESSIAFAQCSIYYSWYNISNTLQNNIFYYNWVDSNGTPTNYTITIPNGLYEISALNEQLQFSMIQNGHYLVDSGGLNVFYIEFSVNPSRYAVQINTYLFPTSLPSGFSNPANIAFPPQSFNPILTLPANVNRILGFIVNFATDQNLNNSYTPPTSDYVSKLGNGTISYISTIAPNVQPNNSLIFTLSNIDNEYATPSSVLYTLVPTVRPGQIINEQPSNFIWNKLIPGNYNELRLTILGTDLQQITINDPSITIVLVIKEKGE